jgi:uncharacterized protein HemY
LGTEALKRRDYPTALDHLMRSLSLEYDANTLRKIGEVYEKLKNYTAAEKYYVKGEKKAFLFDYFIPYIYIQ